MRMRTVSSAAPSCHSCRRLIRSRGGHCRLRAKSDFEDVPLFTDVAAVAPSAPGQGVASRPSFEEQLGAVELKSAKGADYTALLDALKRQDFLEADDIHRKKLIEIAGEAAQERGWVYFSEVKTIPVEDLQTIDGLWVAASGGKFGFSVQRQIWRACDRNWAKFFQQIDWVKGERLNYRVWPAEFIYSASDASKGHLPLTNALRGTQLLEAILTHPAFEQTSEKKWD